MNAIQSFLFAAAVLAALVGVVFLAGTGHYLQGYLFATGEVARRDHLAGLDVGLRYTFGAFAVAAILVLPVRRVLPRGLVRLLTAPAVITGLALLVWYAWRLAAAA